MQVSKLVGGKWSTLMKWPVSATYVGARSASQITSLYQQTVSYQQNKQNKQKYNRQRHT